MDRRRLLPVALATAALAPVAHAQYPDYERPQIGGTVGVYMPSDSATRKAFGNSVLNLGLGPVGGQRPKAGTLTPDLSFLRAEKNGNRLFIGSFTYGYEYHFADDKAMTIPYARVFGGASYFDYGVDTANGRKSKKNIGATYGAEVGLVFASRLRVAARYNAYGEQSGLDFNGFNLSATWSLFRL